jgi:hypothetical protein
VAGVQAAQRLVGLRVDPRVQLDGRLIARPNPMRLGDQPSQPVGFNSGVVALGVGLVGRRVVVRPGLGPGYFREHHAEFARARSVSGGNAPVGGAASGSDISARRIH